jgi:hypothetical protein
MPNFKPKNIKKMVVSKNITTLDGKHKELIDSFNTDKLELLPALLAEKTVICQKIKNNNANGDDINIDELLEMTDRLADIRNKIRLIKKKEKDYLLNNSSYVFDYFETKKKIVDCENKTTSLDNFFKINKNVDTTSMRSIWIYLNLLW